MIVKYSDAGWSNMMNDIMICKSCGKPVTSDEKGLSKKLINRGTTDYYCITCLSEFFHVSENDLKNKILYYKKFGCTLFS